MASGISDLGSGAGYIYKVDVDKTTILTPYLNTEENARNIKVEGLKATSSALNRVPTATITVDTVTGVGSITAIPVGGYNQIVNAIAYTGADTTSTLATKIYNEINSSYATGAGVIKEYTATVDGNVVTLIGEASIGSSANGDTVTVTNTGLSSYTTTVVSGGSDATEVYDTAIGFTFFLNADYDAAGCSGSGTATPESLTNAVEITEYIVPRHLNSALDVQAAVISAGVASYTRKSAISNFTVDTEAAAATDDLITISADGFATGDVIMMSGLSATKVTTFKDASGAGGNIELQNAVDFVTEGLENALTLRLVASTWYEVSRSTQAIGSTSDYRTAGFGFFGNETFNSAATAGSGTVTFNGSTDPKYQKLTGGVTLTANSSYALGTGVNGDEFWLEYDSAVTVGAFALSIFGITVTTDQAISGSLIFHAKYMGGAWYSTVSANLNDTATYPFTLPTKSIKANAVTVAKVETTLSTETITRRVSFESGEQCDNQIKMSYPGTVVEVYFSVDKVIAGTDSGTITPKDNAATVMTSGLITATASSALDTGFTSVPTANNTFIAGDVLNFTTAKTTAGGFGTLSIKVTKS